MKKLLYLFFLVITSFFLSCKATGRLPDAPGTTFATVSNSGEMFTSSRIFERINPGLDFPASVYEGVLTVLFVTECKIDPGARIEVRARMIKQAGRHNYATLSVLRTMEGQTNEDGYETRSYLANFPTERGKFRIEIDARVVGQGQQTAYFRNLVTTHFWRK